MRLYAVPHDLAAAMATGRGKRMDGTLEAIKDMGLTGHHNLKGLVVFVSTDLALRHVTASLHR
jgi:hypothetical protein